MHILHVTMAAILVTSVAAIPTFDIPINTNAVIRSFIGGPSDDEGDERFFEDGRKRERDGTNQSPATPFPFPILSGFRRVFGAINNSTREGVRNVAIAVFPQIFGSPKNQVGFRTEPELPNPQILKSFRIHADEEKEQEEDGDDVIDSEDKAIRDKVSNQRRTTRKQPPTTKKPSTTKRSPTEPPFFGNPLKVVQAWYNSTVAGFRNLSRTAFPILYSGDKKKSRKNNAAASQ